jgi:hypothetical protein
LAKILPVLSLLLFTVIFKAEAGEKDSVDQRKLQTYAIGGAVLYTGTIIGLSEIWYSDKPKQSFRFFNDNAEWRQMDKFGHFYGSFQFSHATYKLLSNSGVTRQKAIWYGTLAGPLMLLPIEILDGFSSGYGASAGDLIANSLGGVLMGSQYALWNEIRIAPKFSFWPSGLASKRPEILGNGLTEELIKDYNGQTYWFSFDIYAIAGKKKNFPKWLNFAVGYGAENMVHARDYVNRQMGYNAINQYYLALDIDLKYFKTGSKFLNTVLYLMDLVKFPAPGLMYNRNEGISFHPIIF